MKIMKVSLSILKVQIAFVLSFSFFSCNSRQEKNLDDLKFIPIAAPETSIVLNEKNYYSFPTIIKFSFDQIVISRYLESDYYDTGYEDFTIKINSITFIEDDEGDYQCTVIHTDSGNIKITEDLENSSIYHLDGHQGRYYKVLVLDKNLMDQLENVKKYGYNL